MVWPFRPPTRETERKSSVGTKANLAKVQRVRREIGKQEEKVAIVGLLSVSKENRNEEREGERFGW